MSNKLPQTYWLKSINSFSGHDLEGQQFEQDWTKLVCASTGLRFIDVCGQLLVRYVTWILEVTSLSPWKIEQLDHVHPIIHQASLGSFSSL